MFYKDISPSKNKRQLRRQGAPNHSVFFQTDDLEAVRIVQHDPNSKENCPSHFQYFSSFFFI